MGQRVTCMGALHPKSMFIKLPTTQYRYDQKFKLLLRACCPSGKNLIERKWAGSSLVPRRSLLTGSITGKGGSMVITLTLIYPVV